MYSKLSGGCLNLNKCQRSYNVILHLICLYTLWPLHYLSLYYTSAPHWPPWSFFKALLTFLHQGFCTPCPFCLSAFSTAFWQASSLTSFRHMITCLLGIKNKYSYLPFLCSLKLPGWNHMYLKWKQYTLGKGISDVCKSSSYFKALEHWKVNH